MKAVVKMPSAEKSSPYASKLVRFVGEVALYAGLVLIFCIYTIRYIAVVAYAEDKSAAFFYDFKFFYTGIFDFYQAGNLYHPVAQFTFDRIYHDTNNISPIGALFYLPLSLFSFMVAGAIWTVIALVLLVGTLVYLYRAFEWPRSIKWRAVAGVLVYACFPVAYSIQLGNWGIPIAFLDIAGWYYARRGADRRAGLLLGLASVVRWQPMTIVLLMLLYRRWRFLIYAAAVGVSLLVLSFVVFGSQNYATFIELVFKVGGSGTVNGYDGSLHATISRLLGGGLALGLRVLASLALLGFFLWRSRKLSFDYAYSLAIVTGLLIVPLGWMHYFVALLLPLMVLVRSRNYWPVVMTLLIWFSNNAFFKIDFEAVPLLGGTLLTLNLLLLYGLLARGEPTTQPDPLPAPEPRQTVQV